MSRPTEHPSFLRVIRWVAACLLCALAVTLSATSLTSYFVVRGALQTVAWGQGEVFVQAIERATKRAARLDEAALKAVLAEEEPHGLRCLVLFDRELQSLTAVGTCLTPAATWRELAAQRGSSELSTIGDRMRIVMGPPAPGSGAPPGLLTTPYGMPPPPGAPWPSSSEPGEPGAAPGPPFPGPPPNAVGSPPRHELHAGQSLLRPMLIEFASQVAQQLRGSAARALLSGAVATLVLLVAAGLFWHLTLREERSYASKERQRQLASLGEMAAVLAHELRNPLAALKGHAQLLVEQLAEGSRQRDKAGRVVSEAERLEALSEDLLSFVRTTVIEPQSTDPAELLRQCASAIDEARIDVVTEDESGKAPARWRLDPARMHQVLCNLLRNAVEASPPGGRVLAGVRTEKDDLIFYVRDFGKGIQVQQLEKIFEPFYTTRARGTGLGLPIARRLVVLHGGTLSASNAPEGGALFTVRLPAAGGSP
jgi:two-component system sensor histidine kinase HydH